MLFARKPFAGYVKIVYPQALTKMVAYTAKVFQLYILSNFSSLYQKIDTDGVQCWNEAEEGSGRTVFRAWEERMDQEKMVESDVDPELLLHIPLVIAQII